MRINIEMISYETAYMLLQEIAPEVAKQMDDTKVIDELLVKLGFASKAPISVDLHISIEDLDRLIKICEKEYNDFWNNPNHKWDTPEQERFEDYCDLRNFLILYKNGVTGINLKSELVQLCESLKQNESIKNKLVIDESEKFIEIKFNEYLTLSGDNHQINMNNNYNHFHFRDNNHFKYFILSIANGETIFIENRKTFSLKWLKGIILQPWNLKMMNRNKYENKKWKYLSKKWLRIYTGNEIIKRDFIDYKKYDNPENK